MDSRITTQLQVVTQAAIKPGQLTEQVALFKPDGTVLTPLATPAAHQANSSAADVATLKTDFNALLAKLQAAGLMA